MFRRVYDSGNIVCDLSTEWRRDTTKQVSSTIFHLFLKYHNLFLWLSFNSSACFISASMPFLWCLERRSVEVFTQTVLFLKLHQSRSLSGSWVDPSLFKSHDFRDLLSLHKILSSFEYKFSPHLRSSSFVSRLTFDRYKFFCSIYFLGYIILLPLASSWCTMIVFSRCVAKLRVRRFSRQVHSYLYYFCE